MAIRIGIAEARPVEKLVAGGSALGAGLLEGAIMKRSPTAGFVTLIAAAVLGTVLSMFVRGAPATIASGIATGAIGTFGVLLPLMTGSPAVGKTVPIRALEAATTAADIAKSVLAGRGSMGTIKKEFEYIELT